MMTKKYNSIKNKIRLSVIYGLLLLLIGFPGAMLINLTPAIAEDSINNQYIKTITNEEVNQPQIIAAFGGLIELTFASSSFISATDVAITRIDEPMPWPWQLDKSSSVYQIEIKNKASFADVPYAVKINYGQNKNYKKIFFYDKNCNCWRPLATNYNQWRQVVSARTKFSFVRLAVFSYPDVLSVGKASWYGYKPGNYTASPNWPAGTKLRVTNKSNGKFVDVVVNDFGPDQNVHPDRILDLEKTAFKKIASLGAGSTDVMIEPLSVPVKNLFGVPDSGAKTQIGVSAKSAIIFNEKTGQAVWSKNATTTLPLASLTKMIAVKVFLDTKPSLNRIVVYSTQDEKYNNEYCKPWESARLRITEGETLTVENLLYTSLVGSANNTIESLVRVSGLSRAEFINKMNETVKNLGASSTHFVEPTGLSPENVSSVSDYAIIIKEVISNPIIQKASVMSVYNFSTINTKKAHRIKNTDSLLNPNKYKLTGSKTGYLDEAGYCLMTRLKNRNGEDIIVVTMGAVNKNNSYQDTESLIKYALRQL